MEQGNSNLTEMVNIAAFHPSTFAECFNYNDNIKETRCVINQNCNQTYRNYYPSTLWMHLKKRHGAIYNLFSPQRGKRNRRKQSNRNSHVLLETRKDLVKLVTTHGRPLRLIKDPAMQNVLKRLQDINSAVSNDDDVNQTGQSAALFTRDRLDNDIKLLSNQVKLAISNEVQDQMVSVMIDIASRHGISTLGIGIQYKKDYETINRTIAMRRLHASHNGVYIAEFVKETLLSYNIALNKIYTITTDNGANVVKAVKEINKFLGEARQGLDEAVNSEAEGSGDEEFTCVAGNDDEEEGEIQSQLLIDQMNAAVLDDFTGVFLSYDLETVAIRGLLCGAHSLQLSVGHALDMWNKETQLVSKSRAISTKLRAQNCRYLLSNQGFPAATLDCTTRWNSIYEMIKRFIELRPFIEENLNYINRKLKEEEKISLNDNDWHEYGLALGALKHAYNCTLKLQKHDLSLADLYIAWKDVELQLQAYDTKLSRDIVADMKKREPEILQNAPVLACVYLHPEYYYLLNTAQKMKASEHISQLWKRLDPTRMPVAGTDSSLSFEGTSLEEECRNITELLKLKRRTWVASRPDQLASLIHAFERYNEILRSKNNQTTDPMKFWIENKNAEPQLYAVAKVIFAAGPTQVSVERAFSGLGFILNPHRTGLGEDKLNNMMIMRLNSDLLDLCSLEGLD